MAEVKRPFKVTIYVVGYERFLVETSWVIEYGPDNSQLVWDTDDLNFDEYAMALQAAENLAGLYNVPMKDWAPKDTQA